MASFFGSTVGRLLVGFVVLVVAVIAWILVSPLFINVTVKEDFPVVDKAALESTTVPTAETPVLLAQGQFADADSVHQGKGDVDLYDTGEERVLRFTEFSGTNGPDLFVWLTNVNDPKADKGMIANEGNYVSLGRLKGNVGDQNYSLPADVDIGEFKHVVVWCRAFGVLFSSATLETL